MQVIQCPLEIGDRKRVVGISLAPGEAAQRPAQFDARGLELEDELLQILVPRFVETQLIRQFPILDRTLRAAVL